jgi:hypothetical protein
MKDQDEILQSCLELIASGQEIPEALMERCFDAEAALQPELEAALWLRTSRESLDPRPEWLSASRNRLVERMRSENLVAPGQSWPPEPDRKGWLRSLPIYQRKFGPASMICIYRFALALVMLLACIIVSNGAVQAAQSSLPGNTLYPLKIVQEKAQLAVSGTEVADIQLRIRFSQRRLVEIEALILENRFEYIPGTVANLEEEMILTVESLEAAVDQDKEHGKALAAQLLTVVWKHIPLITLFSEDVPPPTLMQVEHALEVSVEAATATQEILTE